MPNDVASSVFHGSWPTRPSTTQAPHSTTRPNCFSERYGPDGLSVGSSPALNGARVREGHERGRDDGRAGRRRAERKRQPKLPFPLRAPEQGWPGIVARFAPARRQAFAAAAFTAGALAVGAFAAAGLAPPVWPQPAWPRSAGGTCRCGRPCPSPSACPCRTDGRTEQTSTCSGFTTVERVVNVLPQLQVTWMSPYFGWISDLHGVLVRGPRTGA